MHTTLLALCAAPLLALAALAGVALRAQPPRSPTPTEVMFGTRPPTLEEAVRAAAAHAPTLPPVGVWFARCPSGSFWGPYGDPDACRIRLQNMQLACRTPLITANTPNPAFLALAHVCRDDFNATHCACQYDVATPGTPAVPGS